MSSSPGPGLLEREGELATLAELVAAAPRGGRLLAIEGAPGIGKSALIAEAKALGRAAGMRVLGGRGSELERAFSFGVVRQLFEPLLASSPARSGRSCSTAPPRSPRRCSTPPSSPPSRPGTPRWRCCTACTG